MYTSLKAPRTSNTGAYRLEGATLANRLDASCNVIHIIYYNVYTISLSLSLYMYIYIYIYVYTHTHIYTWLISNWAHF